MSGFDTSYRFDIDELNVHEKVEELKRQGLIIVTVNGCFDIIHPGHLRLLRYARSQGDLLIVLLNSDSSIKSIKGDKRPILTQDERKEILASIRWIDAVLLFEEDEPLNLLRAIKPHFHVKAMPLDNEKIEHEREIVEAGGGRLIVIEKQGEFSTTSIIERIKERFL